MAETPKKLKHTPLKNLKATQQQSSPKSPIPQTPAPSIRRSARFISSPDPPPTLPSPSPRASLDFTTKKKTPRKSTNPQTPKKSNSRTPNSDRNVKRPKREVGTKDVDDTFFPVSPERFESKKTRKCTENVGKIETRATRSGKKVQQKRNCETPKKRVYYKKVSYDGGEFSMGDDVYVKRREDASSDEDDPEVEECRMCFKSGRALMIECDDCLGGFHLKCLKPPLKQVPEGEWVCAFVRPKNWGSMSSFRHRQRGKNAIGQHAKSFFLAICGLPTLKGMIF